jgi:hypothetical protein
MKKNEDIKVFISSRESKCDECGENIEKNARISLNRSRGVLCLTCADLGHLVFLPSGDTALTRRSRKHSDLVAVVLQWSKSRKRNERQGLLVEEKALEKAEIECAKDESARQAAREKAAKRREKIDQEYVVLFGERIRALFPSCPTGREKEIAHHACAKYSGRVGRSANAKKLDDAYVRLAVIAHIRHLETKYDRMLMEGWDRHDAREELKPIIEKIMDCWEKPSLSPMDCVKDCV